MQETTFNSPSKETGEPQYKSVNHWLSALYGDPNISKNEMYVLLTQKEFYNLLKPLQEKINYQFNDQKILAQALTHSSFHYEFKDKTIQFNERFEFLGDSIVNFIVGKKLYFLFPDSPEGELSRLRGALVNEDVLSAIARSLDLGENLLLGKGEFKNKGDEKSSLLADAFEALCAAIYFDSKENLVLVEGIFNSLIKAYENSNSINFYSNELLKTFDTKSSLQELTMELYKIHPVYKSIETDSQFLVELWLADKKIAEKKGFSKKKLEKELAQEVLEKKKYIF